MVVAEICWGDLCWGTDDRHWRSELMEVGDHWHLACVQDTPPLPGAGPAGFERQGVVTSSRLELCYVKRVSKLH